MNARTIPGSSSQAFAALLAGGVAAGVLDILYAFVLATLRGGTPMRTLQAIASGLMGAPAFQGGLATATLGLVLHLGITVAAAGVYFAVARRSVTVRRRWLAAGSLFGVLVYLAMNFAVLPLSAIPFKVGYTPAVILQGFVSHAVLVGWPIAFCLHRLHFSRKPSPAPIARRG
jgi:hypothetical protein